MRTPCKLWMGGVNSAGYGYFYRDGKQVAVHRDAWERANVASIVPPHEIDHLCRQRRCFEPTHLEVVTKAENVRRQMAAHVPITICRRAGHPLVGDNVYVQPATGKRHCNACRRERVAAAA